MSFLESVILLTVYLVHNDAHGAHGDPTNEPILIELPAFTLKYLGRCTTPVIGTHCSCSQGMLYSQPPASDTTLAADADWTWCLVAAGAPEKQANLTVLRQNLPASLQTLPPSR